MTILATAPITRADLRRLVNTCDPQTLPGVRDRLILTLGWHATLGRTPLAALTIESAPAFVHLPTPHPDLHTPDLHQDWLLAMAIATRQPVLTGKLFRRIDRHGHLGDSLTPASINTIVKNAVNRARLPHPERYSTHSLRLGGRYSI